MTDDETFLRESERVAALYPYESGYQKITRLCRMVRERDEKLKTDLRDLLMFEAGQADAKADDAKLRAELKAARDLLASISRRAGSASHASAFTDAQEVAQWAYAVLKRIDDTLGDKE